MAESIVSVIIPFLNAERFLGESVDSVLAQTHAGWELLLVDDGSTDGSTEMAKRYARQHPERIRYLEHPQHANRRLSASRNLGARHARGTHLAFLDADDVWLPNKLKEQLAILEAHPQAGWVYGPKKWWYGWSGRPEDAGRDVLQNLGIGADKLYGLGELLPVYLKSHATVPAPSALLIRRELFDRVGGSEEAFAWMYEDQVLFVKLLAASPVFVSGQCWCWYRQHAGQRCSEGDRWLEYLAITPIFLRWMDRHLAAQKSSNPAIARALSGELRRFSHPLRYAWECVRAFLGQIKRRMMSGLQFTKGPR